MRTFRTAGRVAYHGATLPQVVASAGQEGRYDLLPSLGVVRADRHHLGHILRHTHGIDDAAFYGRFDRRVTGHETDERTRESARWTMFTGIVARWSGRTAVGGR